MPIHLSQKILIETISNKIASVDHNHVILSHLITPKKEKQSSAILRSIPASRRRLNMNMHKNQNKFKILQIEFVFIIQSFFRVWDFDVQLIFSIHSREFIRIWMCNCEHVFTQKFVYEKYDWIHHNMFDM